MLIVERSRGSHAGLRLAPLLDLADLAPPTVQVVEPADRDAIVEASRAGVPIYVVDNLAIAARCVARSRGPVVFDTGDDSAALFRATHGGLLGTSARLAATTFVANRARGVVLRGQGHVGAHRRLPGAGATLLLPDTSVLPQRPIAMHPSSERFVLAFLGSSVSSRRAKPAAWELPEILVRTDDRVHALMISTGDGVEFVRRQAAMYGVGDRLHIKPPLRGTALAEELGHSHACLSTQTKDLVGEVRTTGKLADYLAVGRRVIGSRVGTAAVILPPDWLMDIDDITSEHYLQTLSTQLLRLVGDEEAQRDGAQMARQIYDTYMAPQVLAPLWLRKMREWAMLP